MSVGEGERAAVPEGSERRSEQLLRLAAAALLINTTVETEELLALITEQARETVGAHQAVTSLTTDESWAQAITTVSLSDKYAGWRDYSTPPDGSGIYSLVCRENRPMRLTQTELEEHPAFRAFGAERAAHPPLRGWLAAPIVGRDGRNVGLIQVSDKDQGEFTAEDEAVLVQLAHMAATTVENARLYRDLARRVEELDAIYGLADAVARAETLEAIFEHALDALERAVDVTRGSVVLFDADGGIDFRAWRGLSEAYREAVQGRMPWKGRAADPAPFVVDDVLADREVADLHAAFLREGIRSMALVPLVQAGSVLGRFVLYADRPGAFSPADVQLAETMASHVAAAAHRRRAEARLRESGNQLEAIFRSVADGITAQTPDGAIVYANEAAARFSGFASLEEFLATPAGEIVERFEILDEHGAPLPLGELPGRIALVEGRDAERLVQYRFRDSGESRWSVVRATPVLDEDGRVRLAINVFHELTHERRAEERLRVLADAGRTLSSSLDVDDTLSEIARLVVPAIADYCLVDRLDEDGTLRHVVHVHVDPEGEATLDEIRRRYPVLGNPAHPVARVVATHEPLFEVEQADRALDGIALDEMHRALYGRLAPSSFLAVPLVARGRTLGAISLGTTVGSGRRLEEDDLALALELAERAALAVDNAVLYEEAQAEVVERQRSEERLRFLARASQVLAGSLDVEATLRSIARLAVPAVTDWCIVYELRPDGSIERLAVEHAGDDAERVRAVLDRHPLDPAAEAGVARVIRDAEPELVAALTAEELARDTIDPDELAENVGVEPTSLITVPLVARGRTLGAISLLSAESGRRYGEEDLAVATELANRAALAVDNARLFREATESLALLDALFSTAPAGLAFFDTDLRFVRVNEALAEINGVRAADHVGRTVAEVLPELDPGVEDALRTVLETGQPTRSEATGSTPARPGEERTWLVDYYPVLTADSRMLGLGTVLLEITERKRAEAQLRESEERFRRLADTIPALVWMSDTTGGCTYFNRRWLEFTGRPMQQELGEGWYDNVHPEDVARVRSVNVGALKERGSFSLEYRLARRDGVYRWVLDEGLPRFTPAGEFAGHIGACIDIDDRRRAEERQRFLAEASTMLASSLRVDDTLDAVARFAVPRVADWCSIALVSDDGSIQTVAVAPEDHAGVAWARRLQEQYPADSAAQYGAPAVIRSGEPELVAYSSDEPIVEAARDRPELVEILHDLDLRSWLVVPLVARDRILGALTLVTSRESGRTLQESDLALALEIARRAATAVDNARLFQQTEFQRAVLERQGEASIDGLLVVAPDGAILSINQRFADIWQIPDEAIAQGDEAALEAALERVEDPEAFIARVRELYARRETSREELRFRDGRTIERYGAPVTGPDGSYLGYLWSFRDITDRKRIERRLRRTEERFRSLLSATTQIIWTTDAAGSMVERSPSWEAFTGQSPAEYLGPDWGWAAAIHPDDRETTRASWTVAVAEAPPVREVRYRLRRADGEYRRVDVRAVPIHDADGHIREWVGSNVDVEDELRARAEADARAHAAQALEFVADGVFLVDRDDRVALWNPAATRITGLDQGEVVGRPLADALPGWPLADLGERSETRPVEIGGRELWLSFSTVRFAEGTVYAFRDLTEEYALDRLKSDFVSTVSHELRTPLAAIYGAAMTLQRTDVALGEDQRIGLLGVVAGESERLARIVNDVLWASRLDSGVLEVSIESCDAGVLATAVVAAARIHVPAAIELMLTVAPELPAVAADPDKVRQVLMNLVDNAIKYSPDGGLVEVRVEASERFVRFTVSDRGLGIPTAHHGHIFEKFFRLDPNLTRGVGGTGLGLYICRELVRRMHGRISVDSSEGAGSTFAFELPMAG